MNYPLLALGLTLFSTIASAGTWEQDPAISDILARFHRGSQPEAEDIVNKGYSCLRFSSVHDRFYIGGPYPLTVSSFDGLLKVTTKPFENEITDYFVGNQSEWVSKSSLYGTNVTVALRQDFMKNLILEQSYDKGFIGDAPISEEAKGSVAVMYQVCVPQAGK